MSLALDPQSVVARRSACGFTQEAFADALHVDRSTVHRWEAGITTPRPRVLTRMAHLLSCEVSDLTRQMQQKSTKEDAFLLAEDDTYDPDRFYTKNMDPEGAMSDRIQCRISARLENEMDRLYRSKEIPEYGTPGEIIRDALYHRLRHVAEMRKDNKLGKVVREEMHAAALAALEMQQRAREANVSKAKEVARVAKDRHDHGQVDEILDMLEQMEGEVPPPYCHDIRGVIEDLEKWVAENQGGSHGPLA